MKPFLLLSARPEPAAARGEYLAVAKFAGLTSRQLVAHSVIDVALGGLDLGDYSGVILGGGPYNASDPDKSELQLRVEADLAYVVDEVLSREIGFLGLCYGVGVLATATGGVVDRTYGEPPSGIAVRLTDDGRLDPLLDGVSDHFAAFVAHKEACTTLPPGAVLLAEGDTCPVQMFRVESMPTRRSSTPNWMPRRWPIGCASISTPGTSTPSRSPARPDGVFHAHDPCGSQGAQ